MQARASARSFLTGLGTKLQFAFHYFFRSNGAAHRGALFYYYAFAKESVHANFKSAYCKDMMEL